MKMWRMLYWTAHTCQSPDCKLQVKFHLLQAKQEQKKITTVNVERCHGNGIWFLSYWKS
jgi:Pyruvate/2-oxoacid:ferredoxin oxidoreductase delta subunit